MGATKRGVGRPTKYRAEFGEALVEHMKRGLSFESFGASIGVSKETLYTWLKRHPQFLDARKQGWPHLEMFYLQLAQRVASGQVRRVANEEPMLDDQGRAIRDPTTGEVMMRRSYAPANTNAAALIFLMKNLLGYRDKRDVNVGGQADNPLTTTHVEVTREQRIAEIKRLASLREACGED